MQNKIINILTVDVEDYYMVSAFERNVKFEDWDKYESRVVQNTQKVLSILEEFNVKATFFVLGWVAEKFPHLVKNICSKGHEIASHGYKHRLVYNQNPEEFRQDVRRAKTILERIIGAPICGYRAPSYSITNSSLWALNILVEEGLKYDSSIFPIYHDRGGFPEAKRFFHKIKVNGTEILEFPLSTIRVMGYNVAVGGGGYFRLLPFWLTKKALNWINKQNQQAVVYIHPWELDFGQPRIKTCSLSKFRHYVNLNSTEEKLKKLLNEFIFSSFLNVFNKDFIKC